MSVDKNQAIVDFLLQSPYFVNAPVFFNFAKSKDDNKQVVTVSNDTITHRPFIDGSVMKRYTFTIYDYRSISYNPIIQAPGYPDENIEEMSKVQELIDWIREQAESRNFPNFGADCEVDSMLVLTDNPVLSGVDTSLQPVLARYSISIQIDYIDNAKKAWR